VARRSRETEVFDFAETRVGTESPLDRSGMTGDERNDVLTAGELRAFGFTDDLVDRIMRFLSISADDLDASKPDSVVRTAFGVGPASVSCSDHASRARQHVVDSITDMVTGLHGYHASLEGMRRRAHQVDETSETDIARLIVRAEDCAATPTVSAASQCVAPAGEDS
jgi:hypothetical protein